MMKLCDYLEIVEDDETKLAEFNELMCEAIDTFKALCPSMYKHTLYKLHMLAYGDHFSDELAKAVVSCFVNVDGTDGEHWNKESTDQLASKLGVSDLADFYVLMNNYYSDFANVLGSDSTIYAKMAKAMIDDPDAEEGHILRVYMLK